MKKALKAILPKPGLQRALQLFRAAKHRDRPLVTRFHSDKDSVLQCCIAYNKLGGYCVPSSSQHRPAAQKILSGEVYEPSTIKYMTERRGGGDIVHAGTYFGDFIPALSRACAEGDKVWAFEPNPESFKCATVTSTINDLHNVTLTNAGLGDQHGCRPFQVSDEAGTSLGGASRFLAPSQKPNGKTVDVEIVRIDDIVPRDRMVTIVQLDVEGQEQAALSGGVETIKRCKPVLILENSPPPSWWSKTAPFSEYRVVGKLHGNTVLAADS